MRIWVDLTNSPHVLVMRPGDRGRSRAAATRCWSPRATSRRRSGCSSASGSRTRRSATTAAAGSPPRALGLASRSRALASWAKGRRFDAALGHGSNDVTVAAKLLGDPERDDVRLRVGERAAHGQLPAREARRRPRRDPARAARAATARRARKLRRYEGLKEEYYLADFEPDPAVLAELGLDAARAARGRAHAARGLALPPLRAPAVRQRAQRLREQRAGRRAPAHAGAARGARARGRLRRPRAGRSTRSR